MEIISEQLHKIEQLALAECKSFHRTNDNCKQAEQFKVMLILMRQYRLAFKWLTFGPTVGLKSTKSTN